MQQTQSTLAGASAPMPRDWPIFEFGTKDIAQHHMDVHKTLASLVAGTEPWIGELLPPNELVIYQQAPIQEPAKLQS